MADHDLKTITPDTTPAVGNFVFGADSQSASAPNLWALSDIKTLFIGAGSVSVASGKTLTVSNTLTLAGTDSTVMTFPGTSQTLAGLGVAQTFTAKQTITPPADTEALVVSSYSVTGSGTTPMIDLAGTWNTSGSPTAIKLNITNTSSGSSALLVDLQIGGSSRFSITKSGALNVYGAIGQLIQLTAGNFNGELAVSGGAAGYFNGNNRSIQMPSDGFFAWTTNTTNNGTSSYGTGLYRVADAIVGVRGASASAGGALSFIEQTAPSAPAANGCYLYAEDDGAGKTRLMALFSSGAAQQVAIQP
jgi:hypothetical protein